MKNGGLNSALGTLLGFVCLVTLLCVDASAVNITSYYSPRNKERPKRKNTRYIILHTTEGPKTGSLKKVYNNGEAHYFIDTAGRVYRIIHRDRVAFHAGRSMWDGKTNLDEMSIGIEVVGYHDKSITSAQIGALKELLSELQRIYRIPDERVLTHSMVAYGAPNRWHKHSHRGRKRCGMLFAKRSLRLKLGLTKQPTYDPDVRAGRLVNADPYLAKVLYGSAQEQERVAEELASNSGDTITANRSAWDIARDRYNSSSTVYVYPDGKRVAGNRVKDWKKMPVGTKVLMTEDYISNATECVRQLGEDGETAIDLAGDEYKRKTTIYFFPDGRVKRGDKISEEEFKTLKNGTKVLVGYELKGTVTKRKSAYDICGAAWKSSSTFYRFPNGTLVSGNAVDENAIHEDTQIYVRK